LRRRGAVHRLKEMADPRTRRALENALDDPDPGVRLGAAAALGTLGRDASRRALELHLGDLDWTVRAQIAYALSRLAQAASAPALAEQLAHDESALVRNACALALGHIGDRSTAPVLEHALDDESDRVRREAVLALERTGDPDVAKKVLRLLNDPARRVRIAVAVVLGIRKDRASVQKLLARLGRAELWERPALVIALGRIGAPESSGALARAADDPVRSVRVCAVHALAEMRSPKARKVARAKLTDRSWAVRGAAALALGRVGVRSDAVSLLPLLHDPHPWPRRGSILALGRLRAVASLPEIRGALDDPDPEVRLAAVWALGHLGDARAMGKLTQLLRRTRPRSTRKGRTLSAGEGAVRLVSDADTRIFDALVEAVGSLTIKSPDPVAQRTLRDAERSLSDAELDRPARLPSPTGSGGAGPSLRQLFARAGGRPGPAKKSRHRAPFSSA